MFRRLLVVLFVVATLYSVGAQMRSTDVVDAASQVLAPFRVLDTRIGLGARWGRLQPGEVLPLTINGIADNDATTVLLNVTTVEADQPGYVSAWPCDEQAPSTSIVNFEPGRAIPNMIAVTYTSSGVCFSSSSPVQLVVDVTTITTAGEVVGIAPQRLLDTRDTTRLAAGEERPIVAAGSPGVPADASAVGVNVTIVQPSAPGNAVVKPCGSPSNASTINFLGGEFVAHFAFTAMTAGALCVTSTVDTDVIVDTFAYVPRTSPVFTIVPTRALDTRDGTGGTQGAVASGSTARVTVAGAHGVPADAGAATVNVVVDGATDLGYLTVWPCDADMPVASTLNLWAGGIRSNQATIKLAGSGELCMQPFLRNGSSVHIVLDVVGYLTGTTTTSLPAPPILPPPSPNGSTGRPSSSAGTAVGAAQYPVPDGAVIVATNGNDGAAGTAAAPLRTVVRALQVVPTGGTIVVRGGSYFEKVTVTKRVTIQAWPGETVWFDGSLPTAGWVADGDDWRLDGWTTEFDSSPTFTRGAPDATEAYWGFVNSAYPMAAHPDQIFVDGVAMQQVGSRGAVVANTFYHDRAGDRLYLGTDPNGRAVRASALVRAFELRADGVVLRGFGVRRYAPSVPDMGTITVERPNITLENLAVTDNATTGVFVGSSNAVLRGVYIARSGMLGLSGNHADNLLVDRVLSEANNLEHFNSAPVSGGAKITRSRVVTFQNSVFRYNYGPGMWFDESTYDIKLSGNETRSNTGHGISLEISATATVVNNIIESNPGGQGIKVNNTSDVQIWNNTFVGNGRSINIVQDPRRHGDGSPGRDPRYPNDPTMTLAARPGDRGEQRDREPGDGQLPAVRRGLLEAAQRRADRRHRERQRLQPAVRVVAVVGRRVVAWRRQPGGVHHARRVPLGDGSGGVGRAGHRSGRGDGVRRAHRGHAVARHRGAPAGRCRCRRRLGGRYSLPRGGMTGAIRAFSANSPVLRCGGPVG